MIEVLQLIPMNSPKLPEFVTIIAGDDLVMTALQLLESKTASEEDEIMERYSDLALVSEMNASATFKVLKDEYPNEMQRHVVSHSGNMEMLLFSFFLSNQHLFEEKKQEVAEDVVMDISYRDTTKNDEPAPSQEPQPSTVAQPPVVQVDEVAHKKLDSILSILSSTVTATTEIFKNVPPMLKKEDYLETIQQQLAACTSEQEYSDLLFTFLDIFVSSVGNVPDDTSVYDHVVAKLLEVK